MVVFQDLIATTRNRFESWLATNLPRLGVATGIGVTAWSIGATLSQLASEAQTAGWGAAIAALSAELGKEFVVGLVERIRDKELSEEDVARIVQEELDKGLDLPDMRRLLDEVGALPITLEHVLRASNAQLLESLQADLAAYPRLISTQAANAINATLSPQIEMLSRDISRLDARSERILAILMSLVATPHLVPEPGAEPPLLVFVSSLIGELSTERQALRQTIMGLSITKPWIFEFTPATAQPLEESYLDKACTCDFFVLLIDEDISPAVEKEFETALQHNRPILAFLKKDKEDKDQHRSPAAKALISRISTKWITFSDPTDLALKARVAISDEIIRRVRDGLITLPRAQVQHLEQTGNALTRALLNLPPRRYTRLVGRQEEIGTILEKLRTPDPMAPPVIAITGLGGIGKTALAYEVAERAMLEGLFNGLVWESAKLEELEGGRIVRLPRPPSLSFESLASAIARQLGYDALLQLPPSELQNRIRHILQTDSYLIVVDNLETVEAYEELARQLHNLLSPSQSQQPSRALLTSRERLTEIPYIHDHYIRGLSKPASMEFIEQEAHDRGAPGILQAGQRLLDRVFKVAYGMPLAIKLIISQFIAGIPLDTELDRLEGAREEELYKFIYMRLWFKLSIPEQKILIAAAAFASSVARFMLQPVSKTTDEEFETAIPELVRMSLIEPSDHPTAAQRRYSIHPITRWFINAPLRELWEQQKAGSRAT
jgi:hypothetical protein